MRVRVRGRVRGERSTYEWCGEGGEATEEGGRCVCRRECEGMERVWTKGRSRRCVSCIIIVYSYSSIVKPITVLASMMVLTLQRADSMCL